MPTPSTLPTRQSLRPLLMLLLFFALWSERAALQAIAEATSTSLAGLATACGDPNR